MAREIDCFSRREFEQVALQGALPPEQTDFLYRMVAQAPEVKAQEWADFLKADAQLFATKTPAARVKQVNEMYEQLRAYDWVVHDKLVPFKATIAALNADVFDRLLVSTQQYCTDPVPQLRFARIEHRIEFYVDVLMCLCAQITPLLAASDQDEAALKRWLKKPTVAPWFTRFPLLYNTLYEYKYEDIWLMKEFMHERCITNFDIVLLTLAMIECRAQGVL